MPRALLTALCGLIAAAVAGCGGGAPGAVDGAPQFLRAVPPAARSGPSTVSRVGRLTELAAFDGHVVWNEPTGRGWMLVHAFGGRIERLPLRPAREMFAIDLGPGPEGSPTLVYTRCTRPGDCAIHAYDLRTDSDRRLRELEAPGTVLGRASIWRDDLAFTRRAAGSPDVEVLLRDGTTGRLDSVPTEAAMSCGRASRPGIDCRAEVESLDLGEELVAHAWVGEFASDYSQPGTPHVVRRSDGRDLRLFTGFISGACGSLEGLDVQVSASVVQYIRPLYNCTYNSTYLHRYDTAARRGTRVDPPPLRRGVGTAYAMARDGRDTYWLYDPRVMPARSAPRPCKGRGGCRILRSRDLPFGPARPGDPRRSDGAENTTG